MLEHVYLIPLIPLAASLIILFGGKEDTHSPLPYVGIAAMGWCLIQSLAIFSQFLSGAAHLPHKEIWPWFSFATSVNDKSFIFEMPLSVLIDGPASIMLVVVTFVSFLVQLYSLEYMHDDPRFKRFFAYLSFFSASMLGLVVSGNLLITFACWELVGVSSYLLIGFWFEKDNNAYCAKKAFMTTKLGDMGFYLALFLIFATVGSFQIDQIENFVKLGYLRQDYAIAIGLGLLAAAIGKSGQFPLFIWLPDAMAGPTPVSALIHAATMVAAGIYLVGKMFFLYQAAPLAMEAVAWTGLITAFVAATMAIVAYDVKKVLAFSTVSQLGFMMCGLGVGGYTAGLFHLTTHAFFKALLFLGAGSIHHAVHTYDMREMGGLSKKMPTTFVTMVIGTMAIAGIPFLSGWYSKDMILEAVLEHNHVMFAILLFSALLTAFYMSRMIFLTFWGSARNHDRHHHAHESAALMTSPLVLLAMLSVVAGWAMSHMGVLDRFLTLAVEHGHEGAGEGAHHAPAWFVYGVPALVAGSIGLAGWLFGRDDFKAAEAIKARFLPVFNVLDKRYGFDAFFLWLVALSDKVAAMAFWLDSKILDGIFIDGWAWVSRVISELSNLFDALFIDKTVDGFGGLSWDMGVVLRNRVTAGQVQEYLLYLSIGVSLFAMFGFGW
jgi:NADH-quinone oxidoreductase subunit L